MFILIQTQPKAYQHAIKKSETKEFQALNTKLSLSTLLSTRTVHQEVISTTRLLGSLIQPSDMRRLFKDTGLIFFPLLTVLDKPDFSVFTVSYLGGREELDRYIKAIIKII